MQFDTLRDLRQPIEQRLKSRHIVTGRRDVFGSQEDGLVF